jgi:FdhD protein
MAVRICNETGIGLAGYVRGDSLRIAACPERFLPDSHGKISGVTGVILAGGESKRMGSNKALLKIQDERMIEGTYRCMAQLFSEVLLVTNTPETYDFIPCRTVSDIFPCMGPLGGIHSALKASGTQRIFVVACDMPTLSPRLVRNLCAEQGDFDAVVPETPDGLEPLHALYALSGLDRIQGMLEQDERSVLTFLERAATKVVPRDVIERIDPGFVSFRNINTPEEFRELGKESAATS